MNGLIALTLFLILPYLSLALFLGGLGYKISRWAKPKRTTSLRSVSVTPYAYGFIDVLKDLAKRVLVFRSLHKMEGDRSLIVGAMLFHYGIWAVLLGHFAMVIPLGMSASVHTILAFYLGSVAGFGALVGLLILTARRVSSHRVRLISRLDDYFAVGILTAVILSGLAQTLFTRPDYMNTVSPWLVSLLSFKPELTSIAQIGLVTQLHIVIALVFIAYVPLGKMSHVISYVFSPTLVGRSYSINVKGSGSGDEILVTLNGLKKKEEEIDKQQRHNEGNDAVSESAS